MGQMVIGPHGQGQPGTGAVGKRDETIPGIPWQTPILWRETVALHQQSCELPATPDLQAMGVVEKMQHRWQKWFQLVEVAAVLQTKHKCR